MRPIGKSIFMEPTFAGNEKSYLIDTIESTFVSGIGKFVDLFESKVESYTKTSRAISGG